MCTIDVYEDDDDDVETTHHSFTILQAGLPFFPPLFVERWREVSFKKGGMLGLVRGMEAM